MRCAVANCNSTNNSKACEMSFFVFPANPAIQKQWLTFCAAGKQLNPKTATVCMLHFKPEDIENKLQYEMGFHKVRRLRRGTIPSIKNPLLESTELYKERASRLEKRENKKLVASILEEYGSNESTEQLVKVESNDVPECGNVEPMFEEMNVDNFQPNTYVYNDNNTQPEVKIEIEECTNLQPMLQINNDDIKPDLCIDDIENLKAELQALRSENMLLRRGNEEQCNRLLRSQQEMLTLKHLHKNKLDVMKKRVIKANNELENIEHQLLKIFTRGQIEKLKNGMKRRLWTKEDITQAITFYTASPKLYKILHSKSFPIPSIRTLQTWALRRKKEQNQVNIKI